MQEKYYATGRGVIHYWVSHVDTPLPPLVFLPGLTADHRLFEKQLEYFASRYSCLVWDAPGHGFSRPFRLDFSLMDKAQWLHGILKDEGFEKPIIIGQSMGGYVAQCFAQKYPGQLGGFISIDSAPVQKKYITPAEIWMLERTEPVYRLYPWERLRQDGPKGCSETAYGRMLMGMFMDSYEKSEYCALAGHGFRMLAQAIREDLPYHLDCPTMLICGEKDRAGSAKRLNQRWAKEENLPLHIVPGAGHNANTDKYDAVNVLIVDFVKKHLLSF